MLKTSSIELAKLRKGGVGVCDDSKAGCSGNEIDESEMDDVEVDGNENEVDKVEKKVQKTSKSKNSSKSKKIVRSSDFLTPGNKLVFIKLRQAFLKAPIFYHFDPERHIWIQMDTSGYAIGGVLS